MEMGSGSSQTSVLIRKKSRLLYCLDFAFEPLVHARLIPVIDGGIQSDLFHLPFRSDSVDGIWNLGVMEHFTDEEINKILKEFNRVLKHGAYAILFWPPYFGWYKLTSLVLEKILGIIKRRCVKLYPDEINLLVSKKKIQSFLGSIINSRQILSNALKNPQKSITEYSWILMGQWRLKNTVSRDCLI